MSTSSTPRTRVLALAAGAALLAAPACSQEQAKTAAPDAVPVIVAAVEQKDMPVELTEIGTVQAYATVGVRAQVGGVLEKVGFREGQDVHAGDLLFALDARPYDAALKSAGAALERDSALVETARREVERYADLAKKEYVNQDEYDKIRTNAASLEAAVRADQAAVDLARLNLQYCTIRSPIAGRTGQLMVNAGNVVKANADDPMVVINQIEPIYVTFAVPEQELPPIQARAAQGSLEVLATLTDGGGEPHAGSLTFLDNAVDRSTGTVRLKATFPNQDRAFWPGQFVNARLRVSTQAGAVVVPTQALQTGQKGPYVFVVKADQSVDSRAVTPGAAVGAETIILKGLEKGETVVTDGQLRLVPGTKIVVKTGLGETKS
jgi:membrane fusion protein, multidrug efflux system